MSDRCTILTDDYRSPKTNIQVGPADSVAEGPVWVVFEELLPSGLYGDSVSAYLLPETARKLIAALELALT